MTRQEKASRDGTDLRKDLKHAHFTPISCETNYNLKFKSSAPNGQSPQCRASTPSPSPPPPGPPPIPLGEPIRAGAFSGSRPPFCAEPTLLKRERIKTTGGEGRVSTPSPTEHRTDLRLPFEFDEKINREKQRERDSRSQE
ncbi:hypothetical protein JZ751_029991 [Albula glossodonta]|uniref:Uncharacterized protein n=1 Tax=Albula glossodonta TaxID=121402 RepID=A0A8T2N996_9TELE|nr:hypothetical protein JZ751_029991 [Albula glossodonta]